MNIRTTALILASILTLFGCNNDGQNKTLEAKITALEQANKDIKSQVDMLSFQIEAENWERIAFMKPGDAGYSALRFDLGVITVRLANVKPYANGSKITLNFGNLTSARVDGLKAKLDWGKVNDKGVAQNDTAKSREVTFVESLMPGSWTNSDLVLEGIPPTELGFVRLREVGRSGPGNLNKPLSGKSATF